MNNLFIIVNGPYPVWDVTFSEDYLKYWVGLKKTLKRSEKAKTG